MMQHDFASLLADDQLAAMHKPSETLIDLAFMHLAPHADAVQAAESALSSAIGDWQEALIDGTTPGAVNSLERRVQRESARLDAARREYDSRIKALTIKDVL